MQCSDGAQQTTHAIAFAADMKRPGWRAAPVSHNVAANWILLVSSIAYSLLMTPFVVRTMGTEAYGVWSFLYGLVTYADLLYLGLGAALVKYVAEYRAKDDRASIQRVANVVFTVYVIVGLALFVVAIALAPLFMRMFGEPATSVAQYDVAGTCVLIGVRLIAIFVGSVFGGLLFAFERNDVFKGAMTAFTWIRLGVVAAVVQGEHAMLTLSAIFAISAWCEVLVLAVLARAATGGVQATMQAPRLADLKVLYGFGLASLGLQISSKLVSYSDTTLIGLMLGPGPVATYTLPLQLIEYVRFAIAALTGALLPTLISLRSASGRDRDLGPAFLRVARLSLFIGTWLSLGVMTLGQQFLTAWIGADIAHLNVRWIIFWLAMANLCQVVSVHVALPFYQSLHDLRFPLKIAALEAVCNLGLSLILAPKFGPAGVAFATFVPTLLISTTLIPWHLSQRLGLSPIRALAQVTWPSVLLGSVQLFVWALLSRSSTETGYFALLAQTAAMTGAFAVVLVALFRDECRHWLIKPMSRLVERLNS